MTEEEFSFAPIVSSSQMEYFGRLLFMFLFILWCFITLVLYICIERSERRKVSQDEQDNLV